MDIVEEVDIGFMWFSEVFWENKYKLVVLIKKMRDIVQEVNESWKKSGESWNNPKYERRKEECWVK